MAETRQAYRKQQEAEKKAAKRRDRKRVAVEAAYAKEQRSQPATTRFDEATFKRVSNLKQRLNWAIGIVVVLLVVVAVVLFKF